MSYIHGPEDPEDWNLVFEDCDDEEESQDDKEEEDVRKVAQTFRTKNFIGVSFSEFHLIAINKNQAFYL